MPVDLSNEVILRWDAPALEHIPLFAEGGITALWLAKRDGLMDKACAAAGIKIFGPGDIRLLKSDQLEGAGDRSSVVVKDGVWSGATLPKQETIVAGATRRPWVEANGFRVGYLRALYSGLRPVLGYRMDAESGIKPGHPPALSSLELALIDAWAAGAITCFRSRRNTGRHWSAARRRRAQRGAPWAEPRAGCGRMWRCFASRCFPTSPCWLRAERRR